MLLPLTISPSLREAYQILMKIYRLYVVYNKKSWIVALPLTILVGTAGRMAPLSSMCRRLITTGVQSWPMGFPSPSRE